MRIRRTTQYQPERNTMHSPSRSSLSQRTWSSPWLVLTLRWTAGIWAHCELLATITAIDICHACAEVDLSIKISTVNEAGITWSIDILRASHGLDVNDDNIVDWMVDDCEKKDY